MIRLLLATTITALLLGAWLGYQFADKRKMVLINALQAETIKQLEAAEIKRKEWEQISNENYAKYKAIANREPVTVTERVFVRATCPSVPTDNSGSMGESRDDAARAELHADVVRRIAKVTHSAEADVLRCRTALKSIIDKVEK